MAITARKILASLLLVPLLAAGCSSSDSDAQAANPEVNPGTNAAAAPAGVRQVAAAEGAAMQADPPPDLIVLDVRTPEEFAEGHLEGAMMIDFYRDDFAEQIAALDPEVPYLLYCRSGNRSGQTAEIMTSLGFADVADVNGGILAWAEAGLPIVTG
ncbi:MAG: rhodanese-like domain-containing protein [Acidimicrobiales bacterium]|nr:rhodanese-like domain-containing protein [Acidimicrobiales bacterium]